MATDASPVKCSLEWGVLSWDIFREVEQKEQLDGSCARMGFYNFCQYDDG